VTFGGYRYDGLPITRDESIIDCTTNGPTSTYANPVLLFIGCPKLMRTVDALMDDLQLTVEDLAEKSLLAPDRVAAIAHGRWTPSPTERVKIAGSFELEIGDISWGHTLDPRNIRYRQFGLKEDFQK
jgi:hypothetical protein